MRSVAKKSIKKRIFILAVAALLLLSAGFFCFKFFVGEKAEGADLPVMQSYSIKLTPPEDGTGPQDHTALENIGYIVGRLSAREYYHTESVSVANASALGGMVNVKQNVVGSKDYKDGIYIVEAISTGESSFAPSKAMQRFYGKDTALVRYAASDKKSDWNGLDTEWSTEKPAEVLDKSQHINRYGLWATEFSDYVITEKTLLTPDAAVEKEGSEYVLTVSLSVREDAETGAKDSTEYYKRQMRTMGDLDDYPSFASAQLIFRFTEDWTITSLETIEDYSSKKGFEANCKGSNKTTYSYDLADVDISAYEAYFINYVDSDVTEPEEEKLTALDYLSAGFAPLLTQEKSLLHLDANVRGVEMTGDAVLSMQGGRFGGLRMALGDLYLAYEEENIVVRYRDFFGRLAIAECSDLLPDLGGLDLASLESAIGEGELTETDTGACIECSLPLGNVALPLDFTFIRDEAGIRWSEISADLGLFGVELRVVPGTLEPPVQEISQATDLAPFVRNLFSLVEEKKFSLNVAYADAATGFSVTGALCADVSQGITLAGTVEIRIGEVYLPLQVSLADEEVRLALWNVRLKAQMEELGELVPSVLALAGIEMPQTDGLLVGDILDALSSLDYNDVIRQFYLSEGAFGAELNVGPVIDAILQNGSDEWLVRAEYDLAGNAFKVDTAGVSLSLCGTQEEVSPLQGEFTALGIVTQFLPPVQAMLSDGALSVSGGFDIEAEGILVPVSIAGDFFFKDTFEVYANVGIGETQISLAYLDEQLYAQLFGVKGKTDTKKLAQLFSGAEGAQAAATSDFFAQFDFNALLQSLHLIAQGDALRVTAALGNIGADAVLSTDGQKISISSGMLVLGGISVRDLRLEAGKMQGTSVWDVSGAVSLDKMIDGIVNFAAEKKYSVALSYADEKNGLSVNGSALLDVNDGAALSAELNFSYRSLSVPVELTLVGESVWLRVKNVAVCTTIAELTDRIPELLSAFGLDLTLSLDAAQIVQALLGADLSSVIKNIALSEDGFVLAVDADALLKEIVSEMPVSLGTAELVYDADANVFTGFVLGANVCVSKGTGTVSEPENKEEYVPLAAFLQFVEPVNAWMQAKDVAFTFGGETTIQNLVLKFEAEGEIRFADGVQIYLRVVVNDEHVLEILETDGNVQIACNGYRLDIASSELKTVADSFSSLFAGGNSSSDAGALLLFSADGIDLQALLDSLRFTLLQESALGVSFDLSALLQDACAEGIVLSASGNSVTVQAERIVFFGVEVSSFSFTADAADNKYSPDLGNSLRCENLFEFLFNVYTQVTKSDDLSLSLVYDTEQLYASVNGYVNLERAEGSAQITLNLSFTAEIYEGGKQSPTGSHFMSLTILRDMLYLGYSTVGMDTGNPLLVRMPVASLIASGKTVLPILSPILGIREDVYYYNFVVSILDGYVETLNTAVFGVMNTQEWCDLILGIIDEYALTDGTAVAESTAEISLDAQKGELTVGMKGITLVLAAKDMPQISAPADAEKYIDISTIASLLQDLEYSYRYADTGGYTLKGTFTIKLTLAGLDLIELPLSLELRVGFEEGETLVDREAYFYIKTFVPKTSLLVDIVNADTFSEIVIRGGNVYILRHVVGEATQTVQLYREYTGSGEDHWYHFFSTKTAYHYNVTARGIYERQTAEYRAMTLKDFLGSGTEAVVENLAYILNFSTFLKDTIIDNINSTPGTQTSSYDVGDMVTSYRYIAPGGTEKEGYELSLSLAAITGSDSLGSLKVKIDRSFSHEENGVRYYDLSALDVNMNMIGGKATVYGGITHEDPGSDSRAESITDEMIGIFTANGVNVISGGMAQGTFSVARTLTREYTYAEVLCLNSSCNKAEAERWGQNSWQYDEQTGQWIRLS